MPASYRTITISGGNLRFISAATAVYISFIAAIPADANPAADSDKGAAWLNAYPPNFLRAERNVDSRTNYLDSLLAATKGQVVRFAAMPVTVFINDFPDHQFMNSAVRGVEAWEIASRGAVRFNWVSDGSAARISIAWRRLGTGQAAQGCMLAARTITRFDNHGAPYASTAVQPAQVIEVNLDLIMNKSADTRLRILQNIVCHECGHALGLLGHSDDCNDMMYAITDEHSRISRRDINTLLELYKHKADIAL